MLSRKATGVSNIFFYKHLQKWDPIDCKGVW